MSITGFLRGYWQRPLRHWTVRRLRNTPPRLSLERANWAQSLQDPTGFYLECARYFEQSLQPEFKAHRTYFFNVPSNRRGFGENAFHVMWRLLLREFKPANFVEIGVFRGQVISLVALWARLENVACEIHGISPFTPAGDAVSTYSQAVSYYEDTLANFDHFGLPHPHLLRAFSTDPAALELIGTRAWEMMYIDGNHDYDNQAVTVILILFVNLECVKQIHWGFLILV